MIQCHSLYRYNDIMSNRKAIKPLDFVLFVFVITQDM